MCLFRLSPTLVRVEKVATADSRADTCLSPPGGDSGGDFKGSNIDQPQKVNMGDVLCKWGILIKKIPQCINKKYIPPASKMMIASEKKSAN